MHHLKLLAPCGVRVGLDLNVFVDAVDPLVVDLAVDKADAAGIAALHGRDVGRIHSLFGIQLARSYLGQHLCACRGQQIVAIGPHKPIGIGGCQGKGCIAGGTERINVRPIVAWGVEILANRAAPRFGNVQGGVGRLVADGADYAD